MKVLFWFCKSIKIGLINQSDRTAVFDKIEKTVDEKNIIVPWVTVESKTDGSEEIFKEFLDEVKILSKRFDTKNVLLVPFAHLSNNIAKAKESYTILDALEKYLIENKYIVKRAHFGSSKDLQFHSPSDKYQCVFRQFPKPHFKN